VASVKSPLRQRLEDEALLNSLSMSDLTVLSAQRDPFRFDTPANHRDAQWLAEKVEQLVGDRKVHLRGLHYVLLGQVKPDGSTYVNDEANWLWVSEKAAQAARWLGYVDWEQVVDQRNDPPEITYFIPPVPRPVLDLGGVKVELPEVVSDPKVKLVDTYAAQPFKLVFYSEKTSAAEVLRPLAEEYGADLYLPSGEISNTMLFTMAQVAAEDGRPMAVFTFTDCDPAGHQMPISIARKLQALETSQFPGLEFEVRRVALLPDHVREYGLPSTPMKATEKRADKWVDAMGVHQTEIDALATLQPDLLREIAEEQLAPFFDHGLDRRIRLARRQWEEQAQEQLVTLIGEEQLAEFRQQAQQRLDELHTEIEAINTALEVDAGSLDLPGFSIPEAIVTAESTTPPLISSAWPFAEQCARLIDAKGYRG
jgi:hypothetical protein